MQKRQLLKVVVIDNYDSFTWNLVHLIGPLVAGIEVVRNDAAKADDLLGARPDAIVLSPGPCTPNEAGVCLDLIARAGPSVPIFGVCLGMQAIGQAFGGDVVRAPAPVHGKVSTIHHRGGGVFRGLNGPIEATRYHSLVVAQESCPADLEVTAETSDGLIMGLSHRRLPVHGVQFHPESILSQGGEHIVRTFLDLAAAWNREARDKAASGVH